VTACGGHWDGFDVTTNLFRNEFKRKTLRGEPPERFGFQR
jgi:hypothetical protein